MKTILVIDDEFGITDALSSTLSDEGYRVFTASNGQQALEILTDLQPDVIVLDYMMPIMSGAATLEKIRASDSLRDVPVILISGVAESTVRQRCTGYTAFLRKPFALRALLELLDRLSRRAPMTR